MIPTCIFLGSVLDHTDESRLALAGQADPLLLQNASSDAVEAMLAEQTPDYLPSAPQARRSGAYPVRRRNFSHHPGGGRLFLPPRCPCLSLGTPPGPQERVRAMNVFETLPPISPRWGFLRTISGWLRRPGGVRTQGTGIAYHAQSGSPGRGGKPLYLRHGGTSGHFRGHPAAGRRAPGGRCGPCPRSAFLTSSPVSEIIGADLEQVRQLQPIGLRARLSVWDRVPVQGTEQDGQRSAYAAGADYLAHLPPSGPRRGRRRRGAGCT
ncbi:MAG: hypothetical protein ACLU9S_23645 [Oscillospiraceae bacterium]